MALQTVEGIVENGLIRVTSSVTLPEHAKVHVVVPDAAPAQRAHVRSPRLARGQQAADFAKQIIEESADAGQR